MKISYPGDYRTFELMWTCVNGTFIGALYHPPRSSYTPDSLLDYIELCVEKLSIDQPSANIVLAGDFNQLPESAVIERIGFDQLVQRPTRGVNTLDRVFVSRPVYDTVRVVCDDSRSFNRSFSVQISEGTFLLRAH